MPLSYEAEFLPSPRPLTPRRRLGTSAAGGPPLVLTLCALALGSLLLPSPAARAQEAAPELEWVRTPDLPHIAPDRSEGVYVVGTLLDDVDLDGDGDPDLVEGAEPNAYVVRYDPQGTPLWGLQLGGEGGASGLGVASDADGNAYAHVSFKPDGDGVAVYCGAIAKYGPEGDRLWLRFIGDPATSCVAFFGFDVGPDGSVFVEGVSEQDGDLDGDGQRDITGIAKLSPDGVREWTRQVDGIATRQVAAAPEGGTYFLGRTFGEGADFDGDGTDDVAADRAFLGKYEADGDLDWVRETGSVEALARDFAATETAASMPRAPSTKAPPTSTATGRPT